MQAYCVKCRAKREMKDTKAITMKNVNPIANRVVVYQLRTGLTEPDSVLRRSPIVGCERWVKPRAVRRGSRDVGCNPDVDYFGRVILGPARYLPTPRIGTAISHSLS